jgi:hypothetical protein
MAPPYPFHEETKPPVRRAGWLQIVLLLGFLISLLVGLLALIGLYLLNQNRDEGVDPARSALLQPAQIPPHLALLQLAGADADALVRQASNAHERSLAYAVLRYDNTLSDTRRATEMLRLGQQFLDAGELSQAIDAYRNARAVALLVPDLPPLERGQMLARSAAGLLASGATSEAVETALQAQHVAVQLPGLLPAQRAQILQSLSPILRGHGSPVQVRQINELIRNPNLGLNRVALISQWAQLQASMPLDAPLQEAIAARQAAVQVLIDRLVATGGQALDAEKEVVRQALSEEDRLWGERYARINEAGITLEQQHTLIQEQRSWLLLKLRIARGGFGIDLMPHWSGQPDAFRLSLNQVSSNLLPVLQAQIAARADPVEAAMLRAEVWRWLALQSELSFYPNPPLGEFATQLDAAEAELERLNVPPALPIFYDANATPPGFRIARRY